MIDIETLSRLKAMRLSGMAEYFENMAEQTATNGTPLGPEMVKMAVDWEYERRRNSKLSRLRKHAGLAQHGGPPRAPRLTPQGTMAHHQAERWPQPPKYPETSTML